MSAEAAAEPTPEDFISLGDREEEEAPLADADADEAEAEESEKSEQDEDEDEEPEKTLEEQKAEFEKEKEEQLAELSRKHMRAAKREKKLIKRLESFGEEKKAFLAEREALFHNLNRMKAGGDPSEVMTALGQLMGMPGVDAVELLTTGLLKGKSSNSEVSELRKELQELKEQREREATEARQQAAARQKHDAESRFANNVLEGAKDSSNYPNLARYSAENAEEVAQASLKFAYQYHAENGVAVDIPEILARLEAELTRRLGVFQAPETQQASAGGEPGTQKPTTERKLASRTIDSAMQRPARRTREMTEEERLKKALDFITLPD